MKSLILQNRPHWHPICHRASLDRQIPPEVSSWILEAGSLTQRLRDQFGPEISVKVLQQGPHFIASEESRALGVAPGSRLVIREVALKIEATPLILARSLLPTETLRKADRRLWRLGHQPLGEILFSHKDLKRNRLEYTHIALKGPDSPRRVWGRRSLYTLGTGAPLLIAEFFLEPCLIDRPAGTCHATKKA